MGKGLSPLQRGILRLALANRREFGDREGPDASYAEILADWRQWPVQTWQAGRPEGELRYPKDHPDARFRGGIIHGQRFSRREIGAAEYNRALASLSRAVSRLQARGLVEHWQGTYSRWSGVRLTPEGMAAADAAVQRTQA